SHGFWAESGRHHPARSVRSRALRSTGGGERLENAAPYPSVRSDLVLVVVQRSPRLECGLRLRIKLAGGSAAIEAEAREPGLDLAHHVRVQREEVFRILAVQQGHVVDIEDPHHLLDRFRMIVDSDVDPAVIEPAVATTLADHQECRGLLPSLVAARTPARAKGTTAPTATNFDSTAMPRSFVLGSNPTMLKVDGRGRGMGRDIGLPVILASRKT